MVMPYTEEEECWVNSQFKFVGEAFRSVTLGDEFIRENLNYSLGVPVSRLVMSY
jgi:hypothetical protein